ncbi:2'-5' RNA ligase family protein [Sphingomonas bacterium]|uniref:2'-5' RNA ligase family protein n=1 Tax=Sphingomonas bacterium TaxID=1895847 RepID=UPI0015769CE3|nr:2'-5' RNA ligase family protein [Sphingomonas bacterium]
MTDRPVLAHRLFFALRPPPAIADRIIASAAVLGHRLIAADRLHITMFILDDLEQLDHAIVALLRRVGDAVDAPAVPIMLDRLVASHRSSALRPGDGASGLMTLYRQIAGLARSAGIAERRGYRFSPHLTLGYRKGDAFSQPVTPVGWIADELVLIHSHVGQTRHDTLARWRLAGASPGQPTLL